MAATQNCDNVKKPSSPLGIRHLQSILLFIAILCNCCMKVNMSLAVVAMTDKSKDNTFNWSVSSKNTILSSFIWGYVITLVPAGELAARFGGMPIVTVSVAANSLITLLLPAVAIYAAMVVSSLITQGAQDELWFHHTWGLFLFKGWEYVCACRVIQGLFQGLLFPATHNLLSKWIPEDERRLGAFIYAGSQLGDAIQLMSSGYVAEYWGWPAIFYMDGVMGASWTVAYILLGSSSPQDSRLISVEERNYIQNSVNSFERKKLKTPWFRLLTSLPVLAVVISMCGVMWAYYTLHTQIPTYIKNVLNVNIKKNGLMSALPYVTSFLMVIIFGYLFDNAIEKNWISKTGSRKISNSLATFVPSITLVVIAHAPASDALTVSLLCIAIGFHAGFFTGGSLVKLDIAPNFAGTITGICHLVSNLFALSAPFAATVLVADEANPRDWRTLFYIAAAISATTNIFFLIFGTSEKQIWNDPENENSIQSKKSTI